MKVSLEGAWKVRKLGRWAKVIGGKGEVDGWGIVKSEEVDIKELGRWEIGRR